MRLRATVDGQARLEDIKTDQSVNRVDLAGGREDSVLWEYPDQGGDPTFPNWGIGRLFQKNFLVENGAKEVIVFRFLHFPVEGNIAHCEPRGSKDGQVFPGKPKSKVVKLAFRKLLQISTEVVREPSAG